MKLSSSDNCVGDQCDQVMDERRSSLSRLFNQFLVIFFLVQVIIGVGVIVFVIGGEMSRMQMAGIKNELNSHAHTLEAYIEDRLALLRDYSRMPQIIASTMNPTGSRANTVDFMESLPMLNEQVFFCLQDFEGKQIYARPKVASHMPQGNDFAKLMSGDMSGSVDIISTEQSMAGCCFWRLSVPVWYMGNPEGVLTAFIPMSMNAFSAISDQGAIRLAITQRGALVMALGQTPASPVTLEKETRFPGIGLKQEVSKSAVNNRIESLVALLVGVLVCGGILLFVVARVIGKKLLIVPHARLQALSDGLETVVEKRTEDLERRTAQLSLEIRERREAEEEARETGQLVSALLEGIDAAFFIINPENGNIVRSNVVVHRMFGLSPWQLSNRACSEAFAKSPDVTRDMLCPTCITDNYTEGMGYHVDGHSFPIARYLVKMEIKSEEHIGVIILDITERKNLERRLNIAQKLESVGELASGIAHEINTPIQYVGDSVRFVEDAFGDVAEIMTVSQGLIEKCREANLHSEIIEQLEELAEDADLEFVMDEVPKACTRALEGTERVAVIVRAMKNFAHPGDGQKKGVDINKSLENTITVAKNEWKYVAEVKSDFGEIPMVSCLPGDINQVFLNIIVNASHAIGDVVGSSGDKGTITISTGVDGDNVTISISDTGTGIAQENVDKIFDPFFTTKEVGRGTGQGLAIVHDIIVERHGGAIDIESEVGKGTTFIISLPVGG